MQLAFNLALEEITVLSPSTRGGVYSIAVWNEIQNYVNLFADKVGISV